ncbi:outer membrane lipoprotein-sorting protein [Pyxidicoccus parkwayensis]|jgi:Outer membrane lipoprotein-sorting protein|uniref:Outer membrane lipoprotein-sorting protein n=1 Tax=Pyxidicoccus parkwayensis TaxID=2813578 RepID=A0ABX7NMH3_9BACT|nr:outer membrane lipoprotein-sorting protein [Pyxidicoccus parkwaysis]QSQ19554.1 outer membrane lipoprotein-sorting protein [Pyxidicoccus parkwaysis]
MHLPASLRRLVAVLAVGLPALAAAQGSAPKAAAPEKAAASAKMSPEEVLRHIDSRMSFASDFKSTVRMREVRKDGSESLLEMLVYRRDSSKDLLIYITKPRTIAGGGYLRIGKNLWEYEPGTGQWQRTTQRGNIVNTIACEEDFDRSRLAENYDVKDEGEEVVKGTVFRKLYLTVKEGQQVSFPMLRLWVDPSYNIVKRSGYAPSGRVLRTDVIRSYQKLKDPGANQKEVYSIKEVLEVEEGEGTQLTVRYDEVELAPLSPNIFTKTWLEGKLR